MNSTRVERGLRPSDAPQSGAFGGSRGARATLTASLGVVYQGVYALVQVVALGILIRAHGSECFGLWMTVVALTTLLMPASTLGQPSALVSQLSSLDGSDSRACSRLFSLSFIVLCAASAAVLLIVTICGGTLSWTRLLNADGPSTHANAGPTAVAGLVAALLTFPVIHASQAVLARQAGYLSYLANIVSALVALALVMLAARLEAPLWVVGALTMSGVPMAGIWLWRYGRKTRLVPRLRLTLVDRAGLRAQLMHGLSFMALDIGTMVILRAPELLVARMHGVAAVAAFAAVARVGSLLYTLFQATLVPLWPAISDAKLRGDHAWIRSAARRSLAWVALLWGTGAVGFALLGPLAIRWWTGHPELADGSLIAAAIVQALGQGLLVWQTVFLVGLSRPKVQIAATTAAAACFVVLALFLGDAVGPLGVALAQALALLLVSAPVAARVLRPLLFGTMS